MKLRSVLVLLLLSLAFPALAADGGEAKTLKIGPSTQIQLDGASATVDQLKPGLGADVTEDSFQPGYAGQIDAHTPSPRGGAKPAAAPKAGEKGDKGGGTQGGKIGKEWVITAVGADSITIERK